MRVLVSFFAFLVFLAPSHAQERQWSLDAAEREAFLVFGVPETDDVGLSFWCEIGTKKISIFAPVTHASLNGEQRIHIDLDIDKQHFNIIAKASTTPGNNSASLEAPVAIDGTVMNAVATSQVMSITALGHKTTYPIMDADVRGLLRVCASTTAD